MGCDHIATWDCAPHRHSLPNNGIEMVRSMGIYHHATTFGCAPHGHSLPNHGIEMVRIMAIYPHATIWDVPMPQREIACTMSIHCRATA